MRTTFSVGATQSFGTGSGVVDDETVLDREAEPFRSCFARWYGKDPVVDEEIRGLFERDLELVAARADHFDDLISEWEVVPDGLLALVILLDQLPRNMYRNSARMYAYDVLAFMVVTLAQRAYAHDPLSVVRRMFLEVPLMHVESLPVQQLMVRRFSGLLALAEKKSPQNVDFFRFALGYAERHREVIEKFGRFPHRNAILRRASSLKNSLIYSNPVPVFDRREWRQRADRQRQLRRCFSMTRSMNGTGQERFTV